MLHLVLKRLSVFPPGWLGTHPVLEGQPVGDDPRLPLPDGAHLLHVVDHLHPLGRAQHPRGSGSARALLHRPRSAHARHQPHLDAQEDHAAAQSGGLELWQQGRAGQRRRAGTRRGFCQSTCQLSRIRGFSSTERVPHFSRQVTWLLIFNLFYSELNNWPWKVVRNFMVL